MNLCPPSGQDEPHSSSPLIHLEHSLLKTGHLIKLIKGLIFLFFQFKQNPTQINSIYCDHNLHVPVHLCHQLWFLIQPPIWVRNSKWWLKFRMWTKEHLGMGLVFALMTPKCKEHHRSAKIRGVGMNSPPPFNLSHDLTPFN